MYDDRRQPLVTTSPRRGGAASPSAITRATSIFCVVVTASNALRSAPYRITAAELDRSAAAVTTRSRDSSSHVEAQES
jgi:hypothetical protein